MHLPDVFKVGYTTATPRERVKGLNTEQRNRTSQIGFFKLVISRPVIDAYGAEQKLFAAIAQYRVSKGKEFYCLPPDELAAAIIAAATEVNERVVATQNCPSCGAVVRFTPLTMISHACQACGTRFVCDVRGQLLRYRRTTGGEVVEVSARRALTAARDDRSRTLHCGGVARADEADGTQTKALDAGDTARVTNAPDEGDMQGAEAARLSIAARGAAFASPVKKSWLGSGFISARCPSCSCRHEVDVSHGSHIRVQCERCGDLFETAATYTSEAADEVAHRFYLVTESENRLAGTTNALGTRPAANRDQQSVAPLLKSTSALPQSDKLPAATPRPRQARSDLTDFKISVVECPHCARLLTTAARVGEVAHVVCQGCGRQVHQTVEAAVLTRGFKP